MSAFQQENPLGLSSLPQQVIIYELSTHPDVWIGEAPNYPAILQRLLEIGCVLPEINVISGQVIRDLGRVPDYSERNPDTGLPYYTTLSFLNNTWAPHGDFTKFIVNYLSFHQTTEALAERKFIAASELTSYVQNCYAAETYWWIETACSSPDDHAATQAMMPLIIASCSEFYALFDGPEYDTDASLAMHRLIAATFNSPRCWKYFRAGAVPVEDTEDWKLSDPRTLTFADETDRPYVETLSQLCTEVWPTSYALNWRSDGNEYPTWSGCTPELVFGETYAFTWNMNHMCGDDDDEVESTEEEQPVLEEQLPTQEVFAQ